MTIRDIASLGLAAALLSPCLQSASALADDDDDGDGNGESETDVNVDAEVDGKEGYMWTITKGALAGALLGGVIGGTIWLISASNGNDRTGRVILYPAAGGLLVGTGVGIWQVSTKDDALSQRWEYDPFGRPLTLAEAPRAYSLTLVNRSF